MVVRIHNLDKWKLLPQGQLLVLPAEGQRKVRMALNVPSATRVDIVQGEKPTFLTVVSPGAPQTLEFTIEGTAELVFTTDDEVWFHSHEGEETSFDVPDAQSFVRIASRRARNPQLEMMMWRAEQNMNRRLDALSAEYEAKLAELGADPDTGEIDEDDVGHDQGSDAGGAGTADEPAEQPAKGADKPAAT